ncbi:putative transposase [Mycobacterium xenopi 4042]|nr:putative transposase [Mycobacterium xenopi 4042]
MMPGMPEKRTHDYVRSGTTSLFAAFDIADGTVITALHRRHRAIEFRKFLARIDAQVPTTSTSTWSATTTALTKRPPCKAGSSATLASTCTTPQPIPAGSTKLSAGSPS